MLYMVATPIGNMGDMTERGKEILGSVDLVLCEDTRHTGQLLKAYGVSAKLQSFHGHSSEEKLLDVLRQLEDGVSMAYVSDAGTPGISDPGFVLVKGAVERGVEVVTVPGASAFLAALMGSGLPTNTFWYAGYIPAKKGRQTLFGQFEASDQTVVCYESKHRLLKTLSVWAELMPDRYIVVAKELTKMHERFIRGTALDVYGVFEKDAQLQKGEFVLMVAPKGFLSLST